MPEPQRRVIDAAYRAAQAWGLTTPVLMRMGMNGVFASGDVILRVSRAIPSMETAIHVAERLAAAGVRVAGPVRPEALRFGDLSVTAWRRIDADPGARVDWERVGAMVAVVHSIDPAEVDRPLPFCADFPWWQLDGVAAEICEIDQPARAGLDRAIATHRWWIEAARAGSRVLCHGDVHPGNVLVDADGPVLVDWDLLCVGPAEWDHAALATWTARWGGDEGIYEAFVDGYTAKRGGPVDGAMVAAIAEMRLVVATVMRLRLGRVDPAAAAEADRRLAYWRGEPDAPAWRAQ